MSAMWFADSLKLPALLITLGTGWRFSSSMTPLMIPRKLPVPLLRTIDSKGCLLFTFGETTGMVLKQVHSKREWGLLGENSWLSLTRTLFHRRISYAKQFPISEIPRLGWCRHVGGT